MEDKNCKDKIDYLILLCSVAISYLITKNLYNNLELLNEVNEVDEDNMEEEIENIVEVSIKETEEVVVKKSWRFW